MLSKWGSRGKRKENKHVGDHRAPHLGPLFWGTVVHTHTLAVVKSWATGVGALFHTEFKPVL